MDHLILAMDDAIIHEEDAPWARERVHVREDHLVQGIHRKDSESKPPSTTAISRKPSLSTNGPRTE